jgi:hypothetical protein
MGISMWLDIIVLGCLLLVIVGIWLLIGPHTIGRAATFVGRWSGYFGHHGQTLVRWLRTPVRVERFIYRHHRIVGTLLLTATFTVLLLLRWPTEEYQPWLRTFARIDPQFHGLLRAGYLFVVLLSLLAFITGLFLVFRPSAIKPLEQWANQPVTAGLIRGYWARCCATTTCWMATHYRIIGLAMIAGGGYVVYRLWPHW